MRFCLGVSWGGCLRDVTVAVLVSLLRWGWLSSWPHSVRGIDSTEGNQLLLGDVHVLGVDR